jgi:signal transduction histidine kinase
LPTDRLRARDVERATHARERLRWLGQLRWWAMAGAMAGTAVAATAGWSFVSPPGLAAGVLAGVLVNGVLLWRTRGERDVGDNELSLHAAVDLLLLTWLLAFSGGLQNPFSVFFSFHVVLGALLTGRRGALTATALGAVCLAMLFAVEHAGALPTAPIGDPPELLWLIALVCLLGGLTYFALVLAQRLRAERGRAQDEHREAERNLRLFLDALDRLKVGLELYDGDGEQLLENAHAARLRRLPASEQTREPRADGKGWRFAVEEPSGDTRIIDRVQLEPEGEGELGALMYVDRTEELLVEQRHVMLERLATLGRALQGVAHELNTPLMTMQTLAKDLEAALRELPLDDVVRRDLEESIELIIEESRRCKGLTQGLLETANPRAVDSPPGYTALSVAQRAVQLLGEGRDEGAVVLDEDALDVPLPRDPDRVLQVLMNLAQNALLATETVDGDAPRVRITAERGADQLVLVVRDRGPGLPEEVRARLFEPFVTTRPAGEGTGLGLYVSQRIARELGGALEIADDDPVGTCARLSLPERPVSTTDERADRNGPS